MAFQYTYKKNRVDTKLVGGRGMEQDDDMDSTEDFWSAYSNTRDPQPLCPTSTISPLKVESILGKLDSTHHFVVTKADESKSIMNMEPEWASSLRMIEDHMYDYNTEMTKYTPNVEALESIMGILWKKLQIQAAPAHLALNKITKRRVKPWWAKKALSSQSFGWDPFLDADCSKDLESLLCIVRHHVPPDKIDSYMSKVLNQLKLSMDVADEHVSLRHERFDTIVKVARDLDSRVRTFKHVLAKLSDCIKAAIIKADITGLSMQSPHVSIVSTAEFAKLFAEKSVDSFATAPSKDAKEIASNAPIDKAYVCDADYSDESLSNCVLGWESDVLSIVAGIEKDICSWAPPLDMKLNRVASQVHARCLDMETLEASCTRLSWQYEIVRANLLRRNKGDVDIPELMHET